MVQPGAWGTNSVKPQVACLSFISGLWHFFRPCSQYPTVTVKMRLVCAAATGPDRQRLSSVPFYYCMELNSEHWTILWVPSLLDNFNLQAVGVEYHFVWTSGMSKRKGAGRFSAVCWFFQDILLWLHPPTWCTCIALQRELQELDIELKCLVRESRRFPLYLRKVELKFKLSDRELARTKTRIYLPVEGYIQ